MSNKHEPQPVKRGDVKHYTREEIEALNPPDMNENFGYSQTQVVIDGERYDKLTVFAEEYEAVSFASFFKGMLVGFTFTMMLSLFINHL